MASIEKRKLKTGESYVIVFYRNGKKRKVSFGKRYKLREVRTAQSMIESVLDSERTGEPLSRAAASYFEDAPKDLLRRFACLGFGKTRARLSIDGAWRAFMSDREQNIKARSFDVYKVVFERFRAFFETSVALDSISEDELSRFLTELKLKYAQGTVDQTVNKLRTFSAWSHKNGFSEKDVFKSLKRRNYVCKEKLFYVDRDTTQKLIRAAPSDEWRLLIACWRYAGMRREEPFDLSAGSFDREKKIIRVHARKTEHCANKGNRETPITLDFQSVLNSISLRDPLFSNIKKTYAYEGFRSIVRKSGFNPWSKLVQSLRASCENDFISAGFPNHVVAAWIGHSVDVQEKHYLLVTSDCLNRATTSNLWDNL